MITFETTFQRLCRPHSLTRPKPRFVTASLLATLLLGLASSTPAANLYWAGPSGDTNAPTSGIWTTTTPTVWSDGTVSTADVGWTAASAAIFGGTDPQTVGITVGGAISATSLTFNHSGYTLSASSAQTITASANPFLVLAPGTTNTIGANVKVSASFSGSDIVGAATGGGNGGTLVVGGGSLTSTKAMIIQGNGTVVNLQPSATLSVPNVASAFLSIGNAANDNATLVASGGTISICAVRVHLDLSRPGGRGKRERHLDDHQ